MTNLANESGQDRQCDLFDELRRKFEARIDSDFDFEGHFNGFKTRVSNEISQISLLFPEFTPHDEEHHITNLINLAGRMLEIDRIEVMNSAELFLLLIGLYGHDWGMAVSDDEKQHILNGDLANPHPTENIWILPKEEEKLTKFLSDEGFNWDRGNSYDQFPPELWRSYVRKTHAWRSGERVYQFFREIDGGVAEAGQLICEGHWLDFADLRNPDLYRADASVLKESANIRAITVYVRLIDLLDIGEDRTPYALWKFVAPRDPYSQLEWAKHASLRAVTFPKYLNGRCVKVEGSTDSTEVYAALRDLENWIDEQFRGCADMLNLMNDPRHGFDLTHIEWAVGARGFNKNAVQFSFNRNRMFEILSDDIYQGDQYVFLRELLQNSIDAIRMRREVLRKEGLEHNGVVRVHVEHEDDGSAKITWIDNGIGMDEYIIENYFAVAGQSYYQSKDFDKAGLKIDPISKFGVGILSCFMVANRIEIETRKDPNFGMSSTPLRIKIPDVQKHFRIEEFAKESAAVGTKVEVYVDGKKLPKKKDSEKADPLKVTEYLKIIAGFVEFPITIDEGDEKTIVIHPKHSEDETRKRFGEEYTIHQLKLSYTLEEAIVPQDLGLAREYMTEKKYDLAEDLGLKGYEGVIVYPLPKLFADEPRNLFIYNSSRESITFSQNTDLNGKTTIRFDRSLTSKAISCKSADIDKQHKVYRDGILVPSAEKIDLLLNEYPNPKVIVNIPKTSENQVNLSRTSLRNDGTKWFTEVKESYYSQIKKELSELFTEEYSLQSLHEICLNCTLHPVSEGAITKLFESEGYPILFYGEGGEFKIKRSTVCESIIFRIVEETVSAASNMALQAAIQNNSEVENSLTNWEGENVIFTKFLTGFNFIKDITIIDLFNRAYLNRNYELRKLKFAEPPWKKDTPLPIEMYEKKTDKSSLRGEDDIFTIAVDDPNQLSLHEIKSVLGGWIGSSVEAVQFNPPFEERLLFAEKYINVKHPLIRELLRAIGSIWYPIKIKQLSPIEIGQLNDRVREVIGEFTFPSEIGILTDMEKRDKLANLLREEGVPNKDELQELLSQHPEYVPGTEDHDIFKKYPLVDKPFGKFLT